MAEDKLVLVRRRITSFALVGLAVLAGCSSEPRDKVVAPASASLDANRVVVSGIERLPGATLLAQNEIGPPRGGRGAMSYFYYAAPDAERGEVVRHFKSSLAGWTIQNERETVSRSTVEFVKGDAWVSVTATEVSADGAKKVPGYVIVVNAKDAAVLAATVRGR